MRFPHTSLRRTLPVALVAIAALFFAGIVASAQELPAPPSSLSIGLTGALTHNSHRGAGATGLESDMLEDAHAGRALGVAAGIVVDVPIGHRITIDAHLGYESRPGMVINRPSDERRIIIIRMADSTRVLVSEDSVMYRNELICDLVTADALLDGVILDASKTVALRGIGGLAVSRVLRGTATRARELPATIPDGTLPAAEGEVVEDGGRRIVYERDREVDGLRDVRLALRGGLALGIDLPGALYMRTAVYYDFGLTALSADPEWRVSSTFIQLDLLLQL